MLSRRRTPLFAVLVVAIALAGCGSSSKSTSSSASGSTTTSSSKVSAGSYVHSICSAISPFEKDVQARSSALNLSSIKSAAQGKTALQGFLTAVAADTDKAVTQLKAAGTPNVTNGSAISQGIVTAFTQLKSALSGAASQAGSLPTNSAQSFKTAAQTLGTNVQGSMSKIGSSLGNLKSADLEKAASSDPTCKSLASG
ncbi:MAG TPA: hypothetical protein VGI87_07075 [Solirubrobacteraceae bacterium]